MNNKGSFEIIVVVFLIGLSIGILLGIVTEEDKGYKQGQVDCIEGKVIYRSVNKIEWEKIDGGQK